MGDKSAHLRFNAAFLLTWEQIPPVMKDAITSTEDQHFSSIGGVDLPRVIEAASGATLFADGFRKGPAR